MEQEPSSAPVDRDGEQSAVLRLEDIEAEARRRLLASGTAAIEQARQTLAEIDALVEGDDAAPPA